MSQIIEMDTPTASAILPLVVNRSIAIQTPSAPPAGPRPSIVQLEATVESELASFQLAQDEAFARLSSLQDSVQRSLRPLITKARMDEGALDVQKTQISGLQLRLKVLEKEITTLKETSACETARLSQEKESLEANLRSERAAIQELEQRNLETEEAERELRERLKTKEEQFDRCFDDWRAQDVKLLGLKDLLARLESEMQTVKASMAQGQEHIDRLEEHQRVTDAQLLSKTDIISELKQALEAEKTRAQRKEQDLVDSYQSASDTLRGELETSQGKLFSKTLLASIHQEALNKLKTQLESLEQEKSAAERHNSEEKTRWTNSMADKETELRMREADLHSSGRLAEKFEKLYSFAEDSRAKLGRALVHAAIAQDARALALQRHQLRSSARAYADKQRRRIVEKEHAVALRSKDDQHKTKMKKVEKGKDHLSKTLAAVQEELRDTQSELEATIKKLKEAEESRATASTESSAAASTPPVIGPLLISLYSPTKSPIDDTYKAAIELSNVQAEFDEYKQRTSRQIDLLQSKIMAGIKAPASEEDDVTKLRRLEEANRRTERRLRDAVEENVELRERIEGCDELETTLKATRDILKGLEMRLREAVDENADLRRRVGKW